MMRGKKGDSDRKRKQSCQEMLFDDFWVERKVNEALRFPMAYL
jgi:hypothetical protein